jgi:tRNA(Ile)-lysidine synthase
MIEQKVRETIKKYNLIEKDDKIIVALSGGPDSMCLLNILNKLKEEYNLSIHCIYLNHMIREEAKEDEKLISSFCKKDNITLSIYRKNIPELSKKLKLSLEECGRLVRYKILKKELKTKKFTKIATAHHLDDNIETLLMRMFKGTSIKGLSVIKPKKGKIIRPLIECTKSEILEYLEKEKVPFIIDKTNYETTYERNYIRNVILPLVEKKFPNYREHLKNLIQDLWLEEKLLEKLAQKTFKNSLINPSENQLTIDIEKLSRTKNELIIKEAIKTAFKALKHIPTRKQINLVYENIKNREGNKEILETSKLKVLREYNKLTIYRKTQKETQKSPKIFEICGIKIIDHTQNTKIQVLEIKKHSQLKKTMLKTLIKILKTLKLIHHQTFRKLLVQNLTLLEKEDLKEFLKEESKKGIYYIDASNIKSMEIRKRKEGDYMRIKKGKKKLKDIIIDEKLPLTERENITVFDIGNKEICLAKLGKKIRISDSFFVTEKTEKIMIIEFPHLQ